MRCILRGIGASYKRLSYRNGQVTFLMNSVLRRSLSLRPPKCAVVHREPLTSSISRRIPHSPRRYSTHNPDAFKNKAAVGVRPPAHAPTTSPFPTPPHHAKLPAPLSTRSMTLWKCRCSPLRQLPFSFLPAPASISTSGGKSNDYWSKGVSRRVCGIATIRSQKESEQRRRRNRAPSVARTSVGRSK